jgi:hypothetical protein
MGQCPVFSGEGGTFPLPVRWQQESEPQKAQRTKQQSLLLHFRHLKQTVCHPRGALHKDARKIFPFIGYCNAFVTPGV